MRFLAIAMIFVPGFLFAGGSNYGIVPGAHPNLAGKATEWPVPTPRFARDPAIAPDDPATAEPRRRGERKVRTTRA